MNNELDWRISKEPHVEDLMNLRRFYQKIYTFKNHKSDGSDLKYQLNQIVTLFSSLVFLEKAVITSKKVNEEIRQKFVRHYSWYMRLCRQIFNQVENYKLVRDKYPLFENRWEKEEIQSFIEMVYGRIHGYQFSHITFDDGDGNWNWDDPLLFKDWKLCNAEKWSRGPIKTPLAEDCGGVILIMVLPYLYDSRYIHIEDSRNNLNPPMRIVAIEVS